MRTRNWRLLRYGMKTGSRVWAATSWTSLNAPCDGSWPSRNAGPESGAKTGSSTFSRFPYAIVYSVRADALYVKAVMHLHRRPRYWLHRQPST